MSSKGITGSTKPDQPLLDLMSDKEKAFLADKGSITAIFNQMLSEPTKQSSSSDLYLAEVAKLNLSTEDDATTLSRLYSKVAAKANEQAMSLTGTPFSSKESERKESAAASTPQLAHSPTSAREAVAPQAKSEAVQAKLTELRELRGNVGDDTTKTLQGLLKKMDQLSDRVDRAIPLTREQADALAQERENLIGDINDLIIKENNLIEDIIKLDPKENNDEVWDGRGKGRDTALSLAARAANVKQKIAKYTVSPYKATRIDKTKHALWNRYNLLTLLALGVIITMITSAVTQHSVLKNVFTSEVFEKISNNDMSVYGIYVGTFVLGALGVGTSIMLRPKRELKFQDLKLSNREKQVLKAPAQGDSKEQMRVFKKVCDQIKNPLFEFNSARKNEIYNDLYHLAYFMKGTNFKNPQKGTDLQVYSSQNFKDFIDFHKKVTDPQFAKRPKTLHESSSKEGGFDDFFEKYSRIYTEDLSAAKLIYFGHQQYRDEVLKLLPQYFSEEQQQQLNGIPGETISDEDVELMEKLMEMTLVEERLLSKAKSKEPLFGAIIPNEIDALQKQKKAIDERWKKELDQKQMTEQQDKQYKAEIGPIQERIEFLENLMRNTAANRTQLQEILKRPGFVKAFAGKFPKELMDKMRDATLLTPDQASRLRV